MPQEFKQALDAFDETAADFAGRLERLREQEGKEQQRLQKLKDQYTKAFQAGSPEKITSIRQEIDEVTGNIEEIGRAIKETEERRELELSNHLPDIDRAYVVERDKLKEQIEPELVRELRKAKYEFFKAFADAHEKGQPLLDLAAELKKRYYAAGKEPRLFEELPRISNPEFKIDRREIELAYKSQNVPNTVRLYMQTSEVVESENQARKSLKELERSDNNGGE